MHKKLSNVMDNLQKVMIGKEDTIKKLLVALLTGGHVLLEDVPGVGKTLLARTLAISVGGTFRRIQFTPDLLPSDITGFSIYDEKKGSFSFQEGPVFSNFLLADEINRTIPRTQASLLEAMEERQITIDGRTRILPQPFFVMATQNPIELTGTFPLPEAQLDRFLFRLQMGYPDEQEEISILNRFQRDDPLIHIEKVIGGEEILALMEDSGKVKVSEGIRSYIVGITRATRSHPALRYGVSPRASLHLMWASQGLAFLEGRNYTIPDDVKELVGPVLEHRIILKNQERLEGVLKKTILGEIIDQTPIPLQGT